MHAHNTFLCLCAIHFCVCTQFISMHVHNTFLSMCTIHFYACTQYISMHVHNTFLCMHIIHFYACAQYISMHVRNTFHIQSIFSHHTVFCVVQDAIFTTYAVSLSTSVPTQEESHSVCEECVFLFLQCMNYRYLASCALWLSWIPFLN
jgi:hypothetical protein